MTRRELLHHAAATGALALAPSLVHGQKSGLKITGARLVEVKPRRPLPPFTPTWEKWSAPEIPIARPMDLYTARDPGFQQPRPSTPGQYYPGAPFFPAGGFNIEVTTDKGITGLGRGGASGKPVAESIARLLVGQDPFDVEKLWDVMWKSTLAYGRMGVAIHAISGIDTAIWDIVGKAAGLPVYKLIGGATKPRIPSYCTLNHVQHHMKLGFRKLKLALPYGPPSGREGLEKNVEMVRWARELLGPAGEIMLDCWMALTERYTIELAEAVAPYRVYWIEEALPPDDYQGYARLNATIKTTRITTGEHEYTRFGFRRLMEHNSAAIWQPDLHWVGGLTELRRIAAMASAYEIPVIPHLGGSSRFAVHFIMATVNSPWAEFFVPPPGGSPEVYKQFEEEHRITHGPEGIYTQPSDEPGFGWDIVVA